MAADRIGPRGLEVVRRDAGLMSSAPFVCSRPLRDASQGSRGWRFGVNTLEDPAHAVFATRRWGLVTSTRSE